MIVVDGSENVRIIHDSVKRGPTFGDEILT